MLLNIFQMNIWALSNTYSARFLLIQSIVHSDHLIIQIDLTGYLLTILVSLTVHSNDLLYHRKIIAYLI